MKITKGDWIARKGLDIERMRHIFVHNGIHNICRADGHIDGLCCGSPAIPIEEAVANATLIAEAGTVHNETGYTPRQLLEQRDKLLKACEDIVNARDRAEPYGGMIFQQALNNVENAYRIVTN